jgi:SET domain-containing protein
LSELQRLSGGKRRAVVANSGVAANGKKRQRLYAIRESAIHGRGVFATAKIRRGMTILEYKGQRSSWKEALRRTDSDPNDPSHTFLFELNDGTVIDAGIGGNAARWVNHSCDPNCETYEDDAGLVFIRARRRILPGEELTYDYCLTNPARLSKRELAGYTCRCQALGCRGSLLSTKRRR